MINIEPGDLQDSTFDVDQMLKAKIDFREITPKRIRKMLHDPLPDRNSAAAELTLLHLDFGNVGPVNWNLGEVVQIVADDFVANNHHNVYNICFCVPCLK